MTIALDFDHRTAVLPTDVVRTTYRVSPAPLRLTTRGRLVIVAAALAVIAAVVVMFGAATVATNDDPAAVTTVTVQPGQTLWSIAAEARPDADIRETVDQIIRLNALDGGDALPIGATLAVPSGD